MKPLETVKGFFNILLKKKHILLFVNEVDQESIEVVSNYEKKVKGKFEIAVIRDSKIPTAKETKKSQVDLYIDCDLDKPLKIAKALNPYRDRILAIACREEKNINAFSKIIPHVPYLNTPTTESLLWATDKVEMREHLFEYDKKICPRFTVVTSKSKSAMKQIKDSVGFPLVIKPAGLASSLLVTICFHQEELESSLNTIFKKIDKIYKENRRKETPKVLVEEFMEGEMYSIDVYVSSEGKVNYCPIVYVKTGRSIGFDDFFGYMQITPSTLKKEAIEEAEEVAYKAVNALSLRNTTVHIELIKTDAGWKVIELAARRGGFRHLMYELSYGFSHALNDLLIRMSKPPIILKTAKGYTAVLKFYATKEGELIQLLGVKKVKELKSFHDIEVNKKAGEKCLFAKHGGKSVCNIFLFNKNRSDLLADVRRAETAIKITT